MKKEKESNAVAKPTTKISVQPLHIILGISVFINIAALVLLYVVATTPWADYLMFSKSMPDICSLTYKYNQKEPHFYENYFKSACESSAVSPVTFKKRLWNICKDNSSRIKTNFLFKDVYEYTCTSSEYWAPEAAPLK